MSSKVWRPDRCAVCKKPRQHINHLRHNPRPSLLGRLVRLAWPRWLWGEPKHVHDFVDDTPRAEAARVMHQLRERLRRNRRAP